MKKQSFKKRILVNQLALGMTAISVMGLSPAIAETKFSGLIEVEATYVDDGSNTESDLTVPTLELGINHALNDKVDGHVLFLYEEGENDDDVSVDVATINFHPNELTDLSVGRMYVPFGKYESMMVSDPLTLELGETQTEGLLVTRKFGNKLIGSAYVYRDNEGADSDSIEDGGVSLSYESEAFSAGISYISAVNDKDEAGVDVYGMTSFGNFTFIGEYQQVDELGNSDKKPSAATVEVGYEFANKHLLSASYQKSWDADGIVPVEESTDFEDLLPEKRMNIAYQIPITDNASFGAEYLRDTPYSGDDTDAVTLKLAYEF